MTELVNFINDLIWNSVLIYLLAGVGGWFTLRSGFIQFRHFPHIFSILRGSGRSDRAGLSPFQALCVTLAARIGSGNLTGVALALTLGGPGAIIWMWLAAFLGMATAFAESTLAQLYKARDSQGRYRGGPAWYMEKGLGLRWMGVLFTCFLLVGYGGIFNAVQAGSIARSLETTVGAAPYQMGLALTALTALAICGGVRAIARLSQWLVPIVALLYVLLAGWVVLRHVDHLAEVAALVFDDAFGLRQAASGALGYGVSQAIFLGVQRGLFSNEAGTGSAPNIAAAAAPWPPHPASQGYIQMLAVFLDTMVICSATAAIILTSGLPRAGQSVRQGFDLIQQALATVGGPWSAGFMTAIIFVFSFTAIVGNYAYAESSLVFFRNRVRLLVPLLRALTLAMVAYGCLADLPILWRLADMAVGLMTFTNLIALLLLSRIAMMLARDYNSQRTIGKLPTFYAANFPAIAVQLSPGVWDRPTARK
ncbi:alanine/glycine:cation symporter family protein [Martelella alba]|uniref:Sodium:alanine symporter family protein n=1 Tax=Martelella alba TaxID=2590451 RepID=A0ABY2SR63_9HYPH|nr:sodium:alanine symporter family protein [Martelella alba]TKI08705.1 sodium:alanine symporter family protein [Martelella alba]